MPARLLARAVGSEDDALDHPPAADTPEARLSDLYANAVRESAGRLGCLWVVGRERDEKMTAQYASGIVPALRNASLPPPLPRPPALPPSISVDVDLSSISGPRPIVTSRHRRESRSRLAAGVDYAPPPPSSPPMRSLLAELKAPPPPKKRKRKQKSDVSILSLMAVTASSTFLVIVIALFVAQYRGMNVHAMLTSTGHVIAQAVQSWLERL